MGDAATGSLSESSPFLRHFRFQAAPRLKLRHPFEAPVKDADLPGQPSRRPTRWSSAHCLAGGNAKNAYDLDRKWRSLGHLAPAGAPTISTYVTTRERVGRTMEAVASAQGETT